MTNGNRMRTDAPQGAKRALRVVRELVRWPCYLTGWLFGIVSASELVGHGVTANPGRLVVALIFAVVAAVALGLLSYQAIGGPLRHTLGLG